VTVHVTPKRDEVTGGWRNLYDAGHVARMGEMRNAYKMLVGKPERKRPLGRSRRRWEDNIKMDLKVIGFWATWIRFMAQDRDRWQAPVNTVMNI
jgi:hypothetical protein